MSHPVLDRRWSLRRAGACALSIAVAVAMAAVAVAGDGRGRTSRVEAGGDSCFAATEVPSSALRCNGGFAIAEEIGIASAMPSNGPSGSCWEDGMVDNDIWYRWTNHSGDFAWFGASTDDLANYGGNSQVAVYTDCDGQLELGCGEESPWGGADLAFSALLPVAPGETVHVQFDGSQGNRGFERALFTCWPCALETPFTGDARNSLRLIKVRDPAGAITDDVALVTEGPRLLGLRDFSQTFERSFELITRIAVTTSTSVVDAGALDRVHEPPVFYRLTHATLDDCR